MTKPHPPPVALYAAVSPSTPFVLHGYACAVCGRLSRVETYGAATLEQADWCCNPKTKCKRCPTMIDRFSWSFCPPCDKARREEEEREAYAKAEKVTEAEYGDRPVFDHRGKFFMSINDLRDHYPGEECPEWVWATVRDELHFDASDLLENALSEADEDAIDRVDVGELQRVLDDYCADQKCEWFTETNKVVLLAPESADKALFALFGVVQRHICNMPLTGLWK